MKSHFLERFSYSMSEVTTLCQQGLNFFEAASVAQDQQTDFDLAAVLTLLLSENVLSEIIPKANKRRLL